MIFLPSKLFSFLMSVVVLHQNWGRIYFCVWLVHLLNCYMRNTLCVHRIFLLNFCMFTQFCAGQFRPFTLFSCLWIIIVMDVFSLVVVIFIMVLEMISTIWMLYSSVFNCFSTIWDMLRTSAISCRVFSYNQWLLVTYSVIEICTEFFFLSRYKRTSNDEIT